MNYSIPDQELSVDGNGNIAIANALTINSGSIFTNNNNFVLSSNVAGNITIQSSGGEILIDSSAFQAQTGNWQLQPTGDLLLNGQLQVGGGAVLISNVGVITAPQFSVSASGNIQATGTLSVGGNNFNVDIAGNLVTDGTHFTIDTSGNMRIAGDFSLFSGNFQAHENGNVLVGGILSVGNLSVNTSGNLQTFGTIAAGGSLQFTVDATGSIAAPAIKITTTPNAGYVLTSDASGNGTWQVAPVTVPAGADTQIQFNSAGSFGATPKLTWDSTGETLNISHVTGSAGINLGSASGGFIQFQDNTLATPFSSITGDATGAITIETAQNGADNIWKFGADGGLIGPNSHLVYNYPSDIVFNQDGGFTISWLKSDTTTLIADIAADETEGFVIQTAPLNSTWTFGLDGSLTLPPLAAQPGTPATGEIIYNSTLHKLQFYNGTAWETVTSA